MDAQKLEKHLWLDDGAESDVCAKEWQKAGCVTRNHRRSKPGDLFDVFNVKLDNRD